MKKEMIFGIFALFVAMLVLTACQTTGKAGTVNITENGTFNITSFCFDSDKGINENVTGFVNSSITGINKDICANNTMILEYYCDKYEGKYVKIFCPCQYGACYQTINYTNQSINTTDICKDSDNGKNYYAAGNASGYYNNKFYSYSDKCAIVGTNASMNGTLMLTEYYCSNNQASKEL